MLTYKFRRRVSILAPALAVVFCGASLNDASAEHAPSNRSEQVGEICRLTIGLNPSVATYDACVGSIAQTISSLDRSGIAVTFRPACVGSVTPSCATPEGSSTYPMKLLSGVATSKLRTSCAQLGLLVDSDAFHGCVRNLDASLFEVTSGNNR